MLILILLIGAAGGCLYICELLYRISFKQLRKRRLKTKAEMQKEIRHFEERPPKASSGSAPQPAPTAQPAAEPQMPEPPADELPPPAPEWMTKNNEEVKKVASTAADKVQPEGGTGEGTVIRL